MKILFLIFCLSVTALTQTRWTKYTTNPVVYKQNVITEWFAIGQPTMILENDTIKMWYMAGGLPHVTSRMLYTTSIDGIHWNKFGFGASVMDPGSPGNWDRWMDTPEIFHDSTGYKLYYFGDSAEGGGNKLPTSVASIGVATSLDGITWTKYAGNPLLTHGTPGEWDQHWIESPALYYDSVNHQYMMWYSGVDTTEWRIQIGLATSPDGFAWTKHAGNPVVAVGPWGSFDDMWVAVPCVIRRGNLFEMWYSAFSSLSAFDTLRIGYATSTDGIHWEKSSRNPLFSTVTPPHDTTVDKRGPWAPDVVFDQTSNTFSMLYESEAGFNLATAPLDVNEVKEESRRENSLSVFPNPFSDVLYIQSENNNTSDERNETSVSKSNDGSQMVLYDVLGREIVRSGEGVTSIATKQIPAGIYFLRIVSAEGSTMKKIIKQ